MFCIERLRLALILLGGATVVLAIILLVYAALCSYRARKLDGEEHEKALDKCRHFAITGHICILIALAISMLKLFVVV